MANPRIHIVIVGDQGTGKSQLVRKVIVPALLKQGIAVTMVDGTPVDEADREEFAPHAGRPPLPGTSARIHISCDPVIYREIDTVICGGGVPPSKRKGRARR